MVPSFLYRAFCRVLQPIRRACRNNADLAIEIVIRRHEVALRPVRENPAWGYRRIRGELGIMGIMIALSSV